MMLPFNSLTICIMLCIACCFFPQTQAREVSNLSFNSTEVSFGPVHVFKFSTRRLDKVELWITYENHAKLEAFAHPLSPSRFTVTTYRTALRLDIRVSPRTTDYEIWLLMDAPPGQIREFKVYEEASLDSAVVSQSYNLKFNGTHLNNILNEEHSVTTTAPRVISRFDLSASSNNGMGVSWSFNFTSNSNLTALKLTLRGKDLAVRSNSLSVATRGNQVLVLFDKPITAGVPETFTLMTGSSSSLHEITFQYTTKAGAKGSQLFPIRKTGNGRTKEKENNGSSRVRPVGRPRNTTGGPRRPIAVRPTSRLQPSTIRPRPQAVRPSTIRPRPQAIRPTSFSPRPPAVRPTAFRPLPPAVRPTAFRPRPPAVRPTAFRPRPPTSNPIAFSGLSHKIGITSSRVSYQLILQAARPLAAWTVEVNFTVSSITNLQVKGAQGAVADIGEISLSSEKPINRAGERVRIEVSFTISQEEAAKLSLPRDFMIIYNVDGQKRFQPVSIRRNK